MRKRKTILRVTVDIETDKALTSGDFEDLRRWFKEIGLVAGSIAQTRIWRCPHCHREQDIDF